MTDFNYVMFASQNHTTIHLRRTRHSPSNTHISIQIRKHEGKDG